MSHGEEGEFVAHVPPGRYRIQVAGTPLGGFDHTVSELQTTIVDVTLANTAMIFGTVAEGNARVELL